MRFFAEHTSLQSTLLCKAHFFAEHSSLQSTLLYFSLQSALLCRALFFAEHTYTCASLQSTLLCRALFFAERACASLQSTLLCRAIFFAERTSLQSTLLCRAIFFAEHTSLQSTLALVCRAHLRFFAEHTSLQSTLVCRAHLRFFAERSSLQHSSLQSQAMSSVAKGNPFSLFWGPFFFFCFFLSPAKVGSLEMQPGAKLQAYLGVVMLQPLPARSVLGFESFAGRGQMLDGQVSGAYQVE